MTRILIPTDFSTNARHAARFAVQLFGTNDVTYVLVHAHFDPGFIGAMTPLYSPELLLAAREDLARSVREFVEHTGALSVEQEILFGPLSTGIRALIREKGADLVVMGKHGETGSALFGSNTTDMVKGSTVPVLAVPEGAAMRPIKRILLADDHNEVLAESLAILRRIALHQGAEVLIAHMPMADHDPAQHWSNTVYDQLLKDIPHTFVDAHGSDIVDALERAAHKRKADMITVLHRHIGVFGRLFHPSVAKDIALGTDLPLLVLEQKG